MKQINLKLIVSLIFITSCTSVFSSEWSSVVKLEGLWRFSIGDNADWAKPNYDDSNWDKQNVPQNWEQNYEGYNGYGWYRTSFDIRWMPEKGTIELLMGQIDDVDEVFLNGVKIGQTGSFLPNYKSAYNIERKYFIPKGLLQKTKNVIAVRVYDEAHNGGIVNGNIGIYYDNDADMAALDLTGKWKFSTFRQTGMYEKNFDDKKWSDIQVPATWESQGYPDYDGLAWYRTQFTLPSELAKENLYLVLGQIDDMDKVYLNGDLIARTEYLDDYKGYNKFNAYRLYRVYEIPKSKFEKVNVLVVEVMDNQGYGGIYEGPVGIMTYQNAKIILERNKVNEWNNPIRSIFELFFN